MSLLRFLFGFFRPYSGWASIALASLLVFGAATLLVFGLLRPIFAEVLGAEDASLPSLAAGISTADEVADETTTALPSFLEGLRQRLDPDRLMARLLDRLRAVLGVDDAHENRIFLPVFFAVVIVLRAVSGFINGYAFQRIGLGGTTELRNQLYERILGQSSRFFAEHPSGELLSRVGNDVALLQMAISTRLLDFFQQTATLVVLLGILLLTQLKLALICLVLMPAIIYPIVRFGKSMRRTSHRSQERLADLSNLVAEAVRGHRVVQAFGMEPFESRRFRAATRRHLAMRLRAQLLMQSSGPVVETLAAIGAVMFLIYAGNAIASGRLEPAATMAFLIQLVAVFEPVRKLNRVNLIFQESMAAADRVRSLMAAPNDVVERPDAREIEGVERGISFEGVSFAYDAEAVLEEVDLELERGEAVALVGPSGAGKSTLVSLLPRFFDPDAGRVLIDGVDLRDLKLASLRALIGLVTQDTVLFNDTVRRNIAYGRADLPLERVRGAARAAYADEFIAALPEGYDTVIGEGGFKLSGGQRQRLAIARAIVKDPPILILDEATSHLDSESEVLVQKALQNLMRGRTALIIAHRLATVRQADRIVVMDGGRIIQEGTHDELLAAGGLYRRLYELELRQPAKVEEVAGGA